MIGKLKNLPFCIFILLLLALLAIYGQVAGFGFLRFDDPDYTFANPLVKGGLSPYNICRAFADFRHGAIWMPVTWISYMLDISLFGPSPAAHHLVNLALHLANTFLLLKLCLIISENTHFSFFKWGQSPDPVLHSSFFIHHSSFPVPLPLILAVFFWAIHPQRVEAVAWIASRKELLWSFFALLGLTAWWKNRKWLAYGCCALACMSKPTAMVFPLLAILLDFAKVRKNRLAYLPLFCFSLATGLAAIYSQTHPEGMAAKDVFYAGFFERLLNAVVSLGLYLWQMIVPIGIHLDYRAVPGGWPVGGGLGLTVFCLLLAIIFRFFAFSLFRFGRERGQTPCEQGQAPAVFAVMWFLFAILPTLGLFASFGEHARADRFLYLPAMALPLFFAFYCRKRGQSTNVFGRLDVWPFGRLVVGGVEPKHLNVQTFQTFQTSKHPNLSNLSVLAVILLFSCQSYRIASTYRDDTSAFEQTLACDPDHGRALAHIGEARCAAGKLNEGIEMLRRSCELRPRPDTTGKLAYALMTRGQSSDWQEIRKICAPFSNLPNIQTSQTSPSCQSPSPLRDMKGQALEALGTAELHSREWKAAAQHLSESILAPKRFYSADDAKLKLAYAWHNGGRRADAKQLFEAIAKSTRADLSVRAERALEIIARSPGAILFW